MPRLLRTTDAGKSFVPCGEYSPVGRGSAQALPRWHEGKLYWLVDGGLIVTEDRAQPGNDKARYTMGCMDRFSARRPIIRSS
jgi:hypothetical protein